MTTIFDSLMEQTLRDAPAPAKPMLMASARRAVAPPARSPLAGRYVPFIAFDIRHGFHNRTGGVSADIAIVPTPRTRQRLALYGYSLRRRPDGLDLFWDAAVKAQANTIFTALSKRFGAVPATVWTRQFEPALLFTLELANPRFAIFTEMPTSFRIGDPPLRLSTRANKDAADGAAALVPDWHARVQRPSIVDTGGMEGLGTGAPAEQSHEAEPAPANPAERGPAARERMKLERRCQALALLDVYFTRAESAPPPDGWDGMPVQTSPPMPKSGELAFFQPCRYTIRFEARQTRWRYLVAARTGTLDPTSLEVVAADGSDAGFRLDPVLQRLPDGRPAACLVSDATRPILANPEAQLALLGRPLGGRAHRRTLVERLPGPANDALVPAATGPDGQPPPAWSDMHVFV